MCNDDVDDDNDDDFGEDDDIRMYIMPYTICKTFQNQYNSNKHNSLSLSLSVYIYIYIYIHTHYVHTKPCSTCFILILLCSKLLCDKTDLIKYV